MMVAIRERANPLRSASRRSVDSGEAESGLVGGAVMVQGDYRLWIPQLAIPGRLW